MIARRKSYETSVLLTIVFGPIGLAYAAPWSIAIGLVMYPIQLLIGSYLFGFQGLIGATSLVPGKPAGTPEGMIVFIIAACFWLFWTWIGHRAVNRHNEWVDDQEALAEERHQQLLTAMTQKRPAQSDNHRRI